MVGIERDLPWIGEVHNRDIEDIWDGGLLTDGYNYGYQSKEGVDFRFKVSESQDIQKINRVLDVFGQYHAKYMFCCEQLELVHGRAEVGALDSSETCAQVFEGHNEVWSKIYWRW